MNSIYILVLLAMTSRASGPDLGATQTAVSKVLREQQENRKQSIKERIEEETSQTQKTQESLSSLGSQAQRLQRMMPGDASRLSQAAQALSSDMGTLLYEMTEASGRVARLAQGLREDTELFYLAGKLSGLGLEVQKKSQDIADQVCLTVVQPLRQRRMKNEAKSISTAAPALADAGIRFSEETDRLSDLVHGRRDGPRRNPNQRRRNFCDPTDIWP